MILIYAHMKVKRGFSSLSPCLFSTQNIKKKISSNNI